MTKNGGGSSSAVGPKNLHFFKLREFKIKHAVAVHVVYTEPFLRK